MLVHAKHRQRMETAWFNAPFWSWFKTGGHGGFGADDKHHKEENDDDDDEEESVLNSCCCLVFTIVVKLLLLLPSIIYHSYHLYSLSQVLSLINVTGYWFLLFICHVNIPIVLSYIAINWLLLLLKLTYLLAILLIYHDLKYYQLVNS